MPGVYTVREHEKLEAGPSLSVEDIADLGEFARKVLKRKDGDLAASNHVGIVTTKRGTVVEILPKIDLGDDTDPKYERTKHVFLQMLRCWRRLANALPQSGIRAMSRFPMLEVFVRQFLIQLITLARGGLARRYVPVEENLPYLRGRILFREQLRENLSNQARFFVAHDELSVNRPANRLIHSALVKLAPRIRNDDNRQMLRQMLMTLADVPQAGNVHADWRKHHVDRSMPHYRPVMQWVGLFLFNEGLATFSGHHANLSLLFPMEQVFEDFVTHSFRRHQERYTVTAQGPQRHLATIDDRGAFTMKPDISLKYGSRVVFILDTKWKTPEETRDDPKHGINQADLYQLHAYGASYGCKSVALVYPKTRSFANELWYRFFDGMTLIALPFDVTNPQASVQRAVHSLGAVRVRPPE